MKCYNLFLDDKRVPKEVYSYKPEPIYSEQSWTVVRNYDEFLQKLAERYADGYFPCVISLDHDLDPEHYRIGMLSGFSKFDETSVSTPTGWHCLKWFLKFCDVNDFVLPKILMHSQNSGGIINMTALLDEYKFNKNKDI